MSFFPQQSTKLSTFFYLKLLKYEFIFFRKKFLLKSRITFIRIYKKKRKSRQKEKIIKSNWHGYCIDAIRARISDRAVLDRA